ncbi:semaphorin-4B-like [Halichoeres trimaculatus]|uniref:semaphorin-4B-like n=1 Tax=Halichoeres trimaculatus TaxID=147232 RepID=UPI003D9DFE03
MAPSLLFILLFILGSSSSLPHPRRSFPLPSADRPVLLFSLPDVRNTSTLLLSSDASTLYVGARDAVLSLNVSQSDAITLKKKFVWRPSASELEQCGFKGKDPLVDCPNYVSVLLPINSTHLYACGSYAYSPRDAFIDSESFAAVRHMDEKAKLRCPHKPLQRSSAITYDGELFTATTTNFKGSQPQISRHFSKDGRPDVCQDPSLNLLQEPTFVSSSLDPSDRKLYFFFSEVGKEFHFTDELQIPRVAQVCKDDVGGQRILQKRWTSFAKAPLLCQSPKQLPFNILQDVFTLQPPEGSNSSETLFYGVFTSQWSSGPESAVCVFRMQHIRDVFSGSYLTLDTETTAWGPRQGKSNLGKCGLETASDSDLHDVKKSFLTSGKVKPVGNAPVLVSSEQRYSRVAAMRVPAVNGKQYTVLFLLTDSGFLHKAVLSDGGVQVVEEVQVFTEPQLVKSLVLSSAKGVLFVGTSEGVASVPVARCSIYASCSQCVLSRDPLCGWSRSRRACRSLQDALEGGLEDMAQDVEHGNVSVQCRGQTRAVRNKVVPVQLNQAVRLPCQKPSNPSVLSWSSPTRKLSENHFIQSADGSLRLLASHNTFGTYTCTAEEGGHKEVVARFTVTLIAPPRTMSLPPEDNHKDKSIQVLTEGPGTTSTKPSGDPEFPTMTDYDETTTDLIDPTDDHSEIHSTDGGSSPSSPPNKDLHFQTSPRDIDPKEKSYYGELVVVSLLLAVCICALMLVALYMWRQRRAEKVNPLVHEDGSRTDQSMESVPSLSSPGDSGPVLTEVQ